MTRGEALLVREVGARLPAPPLRYALHALASGYLPQRTRFVQSLPTET